MHPKRVADMTSSPSCHLKEICDDAIIDWPSSKRRRKYFSSRQMILPPSQIICIVFTLTLLQLLIVCSCERGSIETTDRWVNEPITETRQKNQESVPQIPAASPNFEAAFQGECGKNNNSNPCEHVCLDLHDGTYECSCFYGFTLAVDGYSCAPQPQPQPQPQTQPQPQIQAGNVSLSQADNYRESIQRPSRGKPSDSMPQEGGDLLDSEMATPGARPELELEQRPGPKPGLGRAAVNAQTLKRLPSISNGEQWPDTSNNNHAIRLDAFPKLLLLDKTANDNRKLATELARGGAITTAAARTLSRESSVAPRSQYQSQSEAWIRTTMPTTSNSTAAFDEAAATLVKAERRRKQQLQANGGRRRLQLLEEVRRRRHQQRQRQTQTQSQLQELRREKVQPVEQRDKSSTGPLWAQNSNNNNKQDQDEDEQDLSGIAGRQQRSHQRPQIMTVVPATISTSRRKLDKTTFGPDSGVATSYISLSSNKENVEGGSPQAARERNLEAARQRLSYDVVGEVEGGATVKVAGRPRQGAKASGDTGDLDLRDRESGDDSTVDADIGALMRDNDELVRQLAHSIEADTRTLSLANYDDADCEDGESKEEGEELDEDLDTLSELVRKTIEKQELSLLSTPKPAPAPLPSTEDAEIEIELTGEKTNEPSLGKSGEPPTTSSENDEALNRSPKALDNSGRARRSSRGRRHNNDSADHDRDCGAGGCDDDDDQVKDESSDSDATEPAETGASKAKPLPTAKQEDPSLCQGLHYSGSSTNLSEQDEPTSPLVEAVYTTCAELPAECESGGRCSVEVAIGGFDSRQPHQIARCRCPIGRGGYLCQKPIQRDVPRFGGRSYLAFPMITEPALTNLRLLFRPSPSPATNVGVTTLSEDDNDTRSNSQILLYSQKFALLLDDMHRVELRYQTDARRDNGNTTSKVVTRVIGSRDVQLNRWNELIVTDSSSDSQATEMPAHDREETERKPLKVILITPEQVPLVDRLKEGQRFRPAIPMDAQRELFVGGTPDLVNMIEGEEGQAPFMLDKRAFVGFSGCIKELSINGRSYNFRSDLNGDSLDGFDVLECCEKSWKL